MGIWGRGNLIGDGEIRGKPAFVSPFLQGVDRSLVRFIAKYLFVGIESKGASEELRVIEVLVTASIGGPIIFVVLSIFSLWNDGKGLIRIKDGEVSELFVFGLLRGNEFHFLDEKVIRMGLVGFEDEIEIGLHRASGNNSDIGIEFRKLSLIEGERILGACCDILP